MSEYIVQFTYSRSGGGKSNASVSVPRDTEHDCCEELAAEYQDYYKDDPNFKLTSVYRRTNGSTDWTLVERMRATREMCELGHRVRADAKIKNRQALKNAYVIFSNQQVQDYMVYLDGKKNEYANMISDELNVIHIHFVQESMTKFFDYDLKPNFKVLGPKGFGKQAQLLKGIFACMSSAAKNNLHDKLKAGGSESIATIDLKLEDLEISFVAKPGYAAATGKVGAIILDTKLDANLIEQGFATEFKSVIQNLRKQVKLEPTDRISLEVFCPSKEAIMLTNHQKRLEKELLATSIRYMTPSMVNHELAHEIMIDNNKYYVLLYKET